MDQVEADARARVEHAVSEIRAAMARYKDWATEERQPSTATLRARLDSEIATSAELARQIVELKQRNRDELSMHAHTAEISLATDAAVRMLETENARLTTGLQKIASLAKSMGQTDVLLHNVHSVAHAALEPMFRMGDSPIGAHAVIHKDGMVVGPFEDRASAEQWRLGHAALPHEWHSRWLVPKGESDGSAGTD